MEGKACKVCGFVRPKNQFMKSKAIWFMDGYSDICNQCIERKIKKDDLSTVDKICQYLDLPFLINEWTAASRNKSEPFRIYYLTVMGKNECSSLDWSKMNQEWKKTLERNEMDKKVNFLREQKIQGWIKRWGNFAPDELENLENMYADIEKSQNIVTSIQREQAEFLCLLGQNIRKKIINGEDASKDLKTYNDTIKAAGFEPKNSRSYGEFESVGEIINFLVKKGYKPSFYNHQEKDLVDITIKNQQAYLRRFIANQPGLADKVEERKRAIKVAEALEKDEQLDLIEDRYERNKAHDFEEENLEVNDNELD